MISAKIIKDSIAPNGKRLTTFELEFPRFIMAEFLTHRMLSRNASSSRAIPVHTMIKTVWNNMATPVSWGRNCSGMQAKEELTGLKLSLTKFLWKLSGKVCCTFAYLMDKAGCHKQIVNRIIEPWSYIKVVASATEWDNFFYLRNHHDAQPEIHELARVMYLEYIHSTPDELKEGEWHLPYVGKEYNIVDNVEMWTAKYDKTFHKHLTKSGKTLISLADAIKLSASLCAQVSYRRSDESIEKAIKIYDRLITSKPCHASPFEHQATPAKSNIVISGNFRGWKQHRQDIAGNVCKKYTAN
jgi:thymidylate synthase ThyX